MSFCVSRSVLVLVVIALSCVTRVQWVTRVTGALGGDLSDFCAKRPSIGRIGRHLSRSTHECSPSVANVPLSVAQLVDAGDGGT
jgi:hypothetical protein